LRRAVLLVVLGACGRLEFSPGADDQDAGIHDTANDAMPCMNYGAWGAVQRIAELATTAEDYGSEISSDGLSLYWGSNNGGPDHLYTATRASRSSTWGSTRQLTEISGGVGDPSVTGDELEIYYTHAGGTKDCIYRASRTAKTNDFTDGVAVPALCDGASHHACPHLSPDGLTMVYVSAGIILLATRPDRNADFPEGTTFPGLFTGLSCPYLSDDLLTLYYEEGSPSVIEYAKRSIPSGAFDIQKQPVTETDFSGNDNEDVSLTSDALEMHFDSSRPGGAGGHDMYFLQRECLSN
jgi:hypothetical protein